MPYQYIYSTKFGSYAFNGIDLNPNPGPRRPFNFFGHVDQVQGRGCLSFFFFHFGCFVGFGELGLKTFN